MGMVFTRLRLGHYERDDIEQIDVDALVDTGVLNLCIPRALVDQLKLKTMQMKKVRLADGSAHEVAQVGGVVVEMMGRSTTTTALVMGDQVLLGAIPMEDMDLVVHPARQVVEPADPSAVTAFVGRAHVN